jgi:hypothetical protein
LLTINNTLCSLQLGLSTFDQDCINGSSYVKKTRSIRVGLQQKKTEDIEAAYLGFVKKTVRLQYNLLQRKGYSASAVESATTYSL